VQLSHPLRRCGVFRAQHGPVRVHEIANGRSLAQELRAAHHRKIDGCRLRVAHDVRHPVAGADRHSRFVDDDQRVIHDSGDRFGGHSDILQVGLAVHPFGRSYRNENKFRVLESFLVGRGEHKAPCPHISLDHFRQAGLVDGHDAFLEVLDALLVDVQGQNSVPQVREARPRHQPDVSHPNYGDVLHDRMFLKFSGQVQWIVYCKTTAREQLFCL